MEKQKRLTVDEAAKILDCSDDAVRAGMIQHELPIGWVKHNGEGKRIKFYIYESKLKKFLGV